jgi:hypothetical protein
MRTEYEILVRCFGFPILFSKLTYGKKSKSANPEQSEPVGREKCPSGDEEMDQILFALCADRHMISGGP